MTPPRPRADDATGCDRAQLFGAQWAPVGECDVRASVLARDLTDPQYSPHIPCRVIGGELSDRGKGPCP